MKEGVRAQVEYVRIFLYTFTGKEIKTLMYYRKYRKLCDHSSVL